MSKQAKSQTSPSVTTSKPNDTGKVTAAQADQSPQAPSPETAKVCRGAIQFVVYAAVGERGPTKITVQKSSKAALCLKVCVTTLLVPL